LTFTSADDRKDSSRAASELNREPPTNIFTGEGRLATWEASSRTRKRRFSTSAGSSSMDIYTEFKQLYELSWGVAKDGCQGSSCLFPSSHSTG
jgi:hypothetical protein